MRVRTGRFLRWATPLPSREQMVVFLRGALVQKKMRRPQEQALDQDARDQTGKICTEQSVSNNVGVEKSRKHFSHQWLMPLVRSEGLEPPRFYSLPPQGSASTNSATSALSRIGTGFASYQIKTGPGPDQD